MASRRVAITGIGVVSPLGANLADFHACLEAGRSGIRRLPAEIAQGSGVQVGATIDWDPSPWLTEGEAQNLDRVAQFAIAAAAQAIDASGLDTATAPERIGVYWGTGLGGSQSLEATYKQIYGKGEWRTRPLTVVMAMSNAGASNVALRHGLRGPFANFSTACSSSAMALGEAMRAIAAGRADAIVAGGAEALLTPGTLAAWQGLRTLAPADAADPAASCKPFDRRRSGLVLGEGAAAFVLEDESRARARGAPIHALLTGYGNTCDAVHMSRPDRDGQVRAMREALAEAGLEPGAIGYLNAHGTATAVGDVVEAEAINQAFGSAASEVRVSSTKSMHGHLLGGAGALEFAVALLALEQGVYAPTAFLEEPDPACKLRHVAERAERTAPPRAVMSNSFAFGGSNVVLVAERAGGAGQPPAQRTAEPAKIFDAGANLVISGSSRAAVEEALAGLAKAGARVDSDITQVGAKWMATATNAASPLQGVRVEEAGLMRIITGPTREAVEEKVEEMTAVGARLISPIELHEGKWTAVCDFGGAR